MADRLIVRCLFEGLAESPALPLDETCRIMATMDAIPPQIGLSYPADEATTADAACARHVDQMRGDRNGDDRVGRRRGRSDTPGRTLR